MNNIKKILYITIILMSIFGGIMFYFKDIMLINDDISIFSQDKEKYKTSKEIDVVNIDLNKFSIPKEDYNLIYDYFSSLKKSGFNKISKDGKFQFVFNKTISKENKDRLIKKIEEILKNKKYKKINSVYVIKYPQLTLEGILKNDFNYQITLDNDKKVDIFTITNKESTLGILEKDLKKYFNDETIKSLEKNKIYIQEKATPSSFAGFAGELFPRESISELKYIGKQYQQGYDITENSVPIVVVKKDKKNGDGILIKNFNNVKYKEIEKIYNNINEFIRKKGKIKELTDDKGFAQQFQNIWNFTEYNPDKYYQLFFKGKGFKIKKKDKNKLLLEDNSAYYVVFFDYDKEYDYDKNKFTPTGYKYYFKKLKTLKTEPIMSGKILDRVNNELTKKGIKNIDGIEYKKIGQMLYYDK